MIFLSLGLPNMGKTQCLMDYVWALCHEQRFFVCCRAGDWSREAGRWRGTFKEWGPQQSRLSRVARSLGFAELARSDGPVRWYAEAPSEGVEEWAASLPPTGVFRFGWPWEGHQVAELVRAIGNASYVDDEIDLVATVGGWQENPLRDFCHRGRHLPNASGEVGQVHILGASRRAQSLHIDVTSLADQVWVFRLQGHRTIQRMLEDRILTAGCSKQCELEHEHEVNEVERVRTLPPYHFKSWQPSGGPASWGKLAPL